MCSDQGVIADLEAEIDTLRLEIEELEDQIKVLKQENTELISGWKDVDGR